MANERFDKFTERARRVLTLAQEEATRFNHNYIGTEHILLGLMREGEGVAAQVLRSLGVELNRVRSAVELATSSFGGLHGAVACAGIAIAERILGKNGPHPLTAFAKVLPLTHALALFRYGLTGASGVQALHNIWGLHSATAMAFLSRTI